MKETTWQSGLRVSVATALAGLGLAGCGGSGTDSEPVAVASEQACKSSATLGGIANAPVITEASWVPANTEKPASTATTFLPAHCVVRGAISPRTGMDGIAYATKFELRLPANWNSKFLFTGGSGLEGTLPAAYGATGGPRTALEQGYAVVSQNGGHDNAAMPLPYSFGLDSDARIDFGYRSIQQTAQTAKSFVATYYQRAADKSYFDGCSTGGRQGMAFAQRFPDMFDGIVAGAPVFDFGRVVAARLWGWQKAAALVTREPGSYPRFHEAMPEADRRLFQRGLLAACDATDGVVDGIVSRPLSCGFQPASLQCTGAKTPECLSADQVRLWEAVMSGPVDSQGKPFQVPGYRTNREVPVAGYRVDPAWMTSSGQAARITGQGVILDIQWKLNVDPTPYLFMTPPDPTFQPLSDINWDTWSERMTVNAPWLMSNPDIASYRDRGGKMILYHGSGDSGPNAVDTANYYDAVVQRNGSYEATAKFARLFLVPGMGHCQGGPSTDTFDRLAAIEKWVEGGVAPDRIIATARAGNADLTAVTPAISASTSRPLCPYPSYAHYNGTGSVEDAANFTCKAI